jgi:glycosyltransferase involved in cell wall biosynthesis
MNKRVSVVIPTLNYGEFIGDAIESVLSQTHKAFEVIVVDDGSYDDTERVVRSYGQNVKYLHQKNAGVSSARNRGIAESRGDFVAFLDADDFWLPEKIEKQVRKITEDNRTGLVHCGINEFDDSTGETLQLHLNGKEGFLAQDLALFKQPVIIGPGSTVMVAREVFNDVGAFDTRLKHAEDWEFCFRVSMKYRIGFVPEILVNYRNHGINATKNVAEMERSALIAWNNVFDTEDETIAKLRRQSFGNLHKVIAGSYLFNGEYAAFARNLLKSLWYRPQFLGYYFFRTLRRSNG